MNIPKLIELKPLTTTTDKSLKSKYAAHKEELKITERPVSLPINLKIHRYPIF